ncbi:MAG TPA: LON peptidase substrate-binding domain-containing protein [Acidimicrobiales bacterium]|nr:LON peptidase substrate-binding domain-containing protein [Acidimicrobiales bacterium]
MDIGAEPAAVPLPMFPLGGVLVPGALLPLHVFEPRYQALVHDCLRDRGEFGVVLIERGWEVGGGDVRFGVGTVAHIRETAPLGDGRWALVAVGTRRLRVVSWLPDDPYPLALVEELPEEPFPEDGASALREAEGAVRRALALAGELGEAPAPATFALHPEPELASWQLAAVAPLGPVDQQRLLEAAGHAERLPLLTAMAADAAAGLAYRLSGG